MEHITLRKATIADLPILFDFEQSVINAERPFDCTIKDGDDLHYYDIAYLIKSADAEVVVAEAGGEIIASGYVRIKPAEIYYRHSSYGYMGFMYVIPSYRGQGVNKKILKHLVDWCRSQGIEELRLEVYDENTQAIKAYEKVGFKKHMIEMRMYANDFKS